MLTDKLDEQVKEKSKQIFTDGYTMSLGEIANMYEDGEIILQPDYQRFFRWNNTQKTSLIESILLGIPIPPIFVYQQEDGIWVVIDGLQRLSTILQFMGKLKEDHNDEYEIKELKLEKTRFLPDLENRTYNNENKISNHLKLYFKRARLDVKLITYNSDKETQYELFQRLNSGGSALSTQEIRNAIMIMEDKEFFTNFENLSKNESFINCLPLSTKQLDEKENLDFLTRYIIYRYSLEGLEISGREDVKPFLTEKILNIIQTYEINWDKERVIFKKVFGLLDEELGENSFKKFNDEKNRFYGAVLTKNYEAIVPGIINYCLNNFEKIDTLEYSGLEQKIKAIGKKDGYTNGINQHRPISRMKKLIQFSMEYF
ncbi:DUF262 domain-containing protein [Staphylococcus simulans]|uniref:DUF262 domain-containing protein n=1 Tax=Staphylococcus simulans TaxID=1286 RepID=UPI0021CF28C9|nr:DUF262 domain-containing protein [Staphylococcus simulans]UXR45673.1 DUF262 domain-containing protein [Staphylococcus simulans]